VGLAVLELCAGGGGQALGLEAAGFQCAAAVEIDGSCCDTLRLNRPNWRIIQSDIRGINGSEFRGIDLLAGGVPCPPFSIAGKQLGRGDERDLFPEALRIIEGCKPNTRRRTDGGMINLTREDWAEIYYALETKLLALRQGKYGSEDAPGQDAKWIAHIEAVMQNIGADGAAAAREGIERSK